MSLHLEFTPHSWYMGFAIAKNKDLPNYNSKMSDWYGVTDDGNTYGIVEYYTDTIAQLKQRIRSYHLSAKNGYGERIAKRRLEYLRQELRAERMSWDESNELTGLSDYIKSGDVELLEAAGVPEETARAEGRI